MVSLFDVFGAIVADHDADRLAAAVAGRLIERSNRIDFIPGQGVFDEREPLIKRIDGPFNAKVRWLLRAFIGRHRLPTS
jgi:hypothetical protein